MVMKILRAQGGLRKGGWLDYVNRVINVDDTRIFGMLVGESMESGKIMSL